MTAVCERFAGNPHYLLYERYLKQLHELMAAGRGDSDEADVIREAMEIPERELAQAEIARLNLLSADLYSLRGQERYLCGPGAELSRVDRTRWVAEAGRAEEWAEVLRRLRTGLVDWPPQDVAYLRARSYERLGHLETAISFLEQASQLDPQDGTYPLLLMQWLQEAGRRSDLVQLAERYYSDEAAPVEARVQAAAMLFGATRDISDEERRPTFDRLAEGIPVLTADPAFEYLQSSIQGLAFLVLGFCHDSLDEKAAAQAAFSKAILRDPDNPGALVARGLSALETDPAAAAADFQMAVQSSTPLVVPYLYLAHDAIRRGRYEKCLELADKALHLSPSTRDIAELHELRAIARLVLNNPPAEVRAEFQRAVSIDPLNEGIRSNYDFFQRMEREQPPIDWRLAEWPHVAAIDPHRARVALREAVRLVP